MYGEDKIQTALEALGAGLGAGLGCLLLAIIAGRIEKKFF